MNDAHRYNNFDLLRLIFASIVVLYHCYDLSFSPAYFWVPQVTSASLAVEGFFAMSGFLIVSSYERSPTLRLYFEKRARRILPAYWAALAFTLVLGAVYSTLPVKAFFSSPSTWKYIAANLSFANFLHPDLPGLFERNPVTSSVNGSLWTIKVEVMFYLSVPVIALLCRRLGRWQCLGVIFLMSVAYRVASERLHHPSLAIQLPGQLCFFIVGTSVYYYFDWFKRNRHWMWIASAGFYLLSIISGWIALRSLGVSLSVMCAGFLLPPLGRAAKHGDFSYGTYVFHFPVIQALIALGLVAHHPQVALLLILISVAILSFTSWNLVEAPWLQKRDKPKRALAAQAP